MNDHQQKFISIRIEALKDNDLALDFDLFIKLSSGKTLKIAHKAEPKNTILDKYLEKGVEELLLDKHQYNAFIEQMADHLRIKDGVEEEEPKLTPEEQALEMKKLNNGYETLKSIFQHDQIEQNSMSMAKSITKRALNIVREGQTLKYLQEFRKSCGQEFMRSIITSQICCCMVDHLPWGNESVKEKIVLGSILCDITLNKQSFEELRSHKGTLEELPTHILNHPYDVVRVLSSQPGLVEPDTLILIEQHHELPAGDGFPKGLEFNRISALTATFIVGNYFVERLMTSEFEEHQKNERIENTLAVIPLKFNIGHFKKAADALEKVFRDDGFS